jgi:hypothetical protein
MIKLPGHPGGTTEIERYEQRENLSQGLEIGLFWPRLIRGGTDRINAIPPLDRLLESRPRLR